MISGKKILIVEDDAFLQGLAVTRLEKAGFVVSVAIDGEQGLKKIKEDKPDLVLLDIVMPGIDGFEVLKQIKKDPTTASIPVIFLTNLGQEEDAKKGLTLGADDYLVKAQFTLEEITEKVERLITKKGEKQ